MKKSYKDLEPMFMMITESFLKSDASKMILDLPLGDKVAHFGLVLWSKDGETMHLTTFYLGLDKNCHFVKCWDDFVRDKVHKMLKNKEDVGYLPANSQEEALREVYYSIYNKVA